MADDRHTPIAGYRDLSTEEIALINQVKAAEREILELVQRVHNVPGANARSASIARTEIQTGFMWLVRALARPNGE